MASTINASTSAGLVSTADTSGVLQLQTAGTAAVTVDASQNVGIGTSSPARKLVVYEAATSSTIQITDSVSGTGAAAGSIIQQSFANQSLFIRNYAPAGYIRFDTAGAFEKMRLDASGNLLVGTTSQLGSSNARVNVSYDGSTLPWGAAFKSDANNGVDLVFISAGNGAVGSISHTSTTTSYNVTSDQRLKENIQDADSASSLIDAIQVRKFDWKSDGSHNRYGFVAQELVTVAPEAVHQPADPEEMMAVDYSKLVPMLVKEIQSLRIRIAQLEAK
jgi:hypothetical protein